MRRVLRETKSVRAGKTVRIDVALGKGMDYGRIYVWARGSDDDDFSPYIDERLLEVISADGRPQIHKPVSFILHARKRHITHEFVSGMDQQFRIIQEIDNPNEPEAIARIKSYGKTAEAIRRFLRNAIRFARREAKAISS